jgi:hypothetical protein
MLGFSFWLELQYFSIIHIIKFSECAFEEASTMYRVLGKCMTDLEDFGSVKIGTKTLGK